MHAEDKAVWKKIIKSDYRRCAVIESYESIRHILKNRILRKNSSDQILVSTLFDDHIDRALNQKPMGQFTEAFSLSKLPGVHQRILTLVNSMLALKMLLSKHDKARELETARDAESEKARDTEHEKAREKV